MTDICIHIEPDINRLRNIYIYIYIYIYGVFYSSS